MGRSVAAPVDGGRSKISPRFVDWFLAIALFGMALAFFSRTVHLTFDVRDEGYFLFTIDRVANGEVPHRDFVCLYGPGVYWLNAQLFEHFGREVMPVRFSLAVLRAAAVAMAYLLARQLVARPFALLGALVAGAYWGRVIWNLTTPYAAVYSIPLGMLALLWLVRGQARGSLGWHFAAGVASGGSLLFKQSLALFCAYGMGLAILAHAMLREREEGPDPRWRRPLLALWILAAVAIAAPFLATMTPLDYPLHFLPIHALMALVGWRFARRGDGPGAVALALPRLAVYGAGFVVVPGAVAVLYAHWGALGDLVYNMFGRPLGLRNYYMPVALPPLHAVSMLLSGIAFVTAVLFYVRDPGTKFFPLFVLGAVLAWLPGREIRSIEHLSIALDQLSPLLPVLTATAALVCIGEALAKPQPRQAEPVLAALVSILCFQLMMVFQFFPRAGFAVHIMLGTLAPVLSYLLYRWWSLGGEADARARWGERAVAFAAVAVFAILLPSHLIRHWILQPGAAELEETAVRFPPTRGIRLSPGEYRRHHVAVLEWLLDHLGRTEPADAPIFVLGNERMITFLSGREALFPDLTYLLYLTGWDMLPDRDREILQASRIIERLEQTPEAILIDRDGPRSGNLRKSLPEVDAYIHDNYGIDYRIGGYRVLRSKRTG